MTLSRKFLRKKLKKKNFFLTPVGETSGCFPGNLLLFECYPVENLCYHYAFKKRKII